MKTPDAREPYLLTVKSRSGDGLWTGLRIDVRYRRASCDIIVHYLTSQPLMIFQLSGVGKKLCVLALDGSLSMIALQMSCRKSSTLEKIP